MRFANFVEETTTSIAGTNGDGAITLTALAGIPRFSHAFGLGTQVVRYVIEDTVGKRYETGVGTVASNVLTRSKVLATWNGSSYTTAANAAPALPFGSTPNSGDIRIRLAMTAEHMPPSLPSIQTKLSSGVWIYYRVSGHYGSFSDSSIADVVCAGGTEVYTYYRLDTAGNFDAAQIEVTAVTGSASTLMVALYDIQDGAPAVKIVDCGSLSISTTGNRTIQTASTWVWLTPGWYAIGLLWNGAGGSVSIKGCGSAVPRAPTPLGRFGSLNENGQTWKVTGNVSSTLPATPTFSAGVTTITTDAPWIALRVLG